MNTKEIIEQARERSRRLRCYPAGQNEIEMADTIDALIAEVERVSKDKERWRKLDAMVASGVQRDTIAYYVNFPNDLDKLDRSVVIDAAMKGKS